MHHDDVKHVNRLLWLIKRSEFKPRGNKIIEIVCPDENRAEMLALFRVLKWRDRQRNEE